MTGREVAHPRRPVGQDARDPGRSGRMPGSGRGEA